MVLKPTPERWATRLHGLKDELWRKRHNREVTEVIDGLTHFGEVPSKPSFGIWMSEGKPVFKAAAGSICYEQNRKRIWLHDGNEWIPSKTTV